MLQSAFRPLTPKRVLAIGAHPDDIDFCASGTLANFVAAGAEVKYLQLTDGGSGSAKLDMSSDQIAAIRRQEQQAACQLLGATDVSFLDYRDGSLEVTMKLKSQICEMIRTFKPDVVVTMDPTMVYAAELGIINHPDHRAAGQAVLDAVYPLARDHLSLPELYKRGLQPHRVNTVLLVNFNVQNFYVDITDVFKTKLAIAQAHASQMPNKQAMTDMLTTWALDSGKQSDCQYAEGFVRIDIAI